MDNAHPMERSVFIAPNDGFYMDFHEIFQESLVKDRQEIGGPAMVVSSVM